MLTRHISGAMFSLFASALLSTALADDEIELSNEAGIATSIELTQPTVATACKADIAVEWYQKGASVHVDAELNNPTCAASSGTYVVQVKYRDGSPDQQSKEFDVSWSRDDNATLKTANDYLIADDIDVTRVRIRKLRCKCATAE